MTISYILPTIGASGVFELASPFKEMMGQDEKYTVKAIRTISEIEANSIDAKTKYYLDNGLTELDYIEQLEVDMHIVSLQSGYGQWLEVPAIYILKYPRIDGVPYQRLNIVLKMPPVPTGKDMTSLATQIQSVAEDFIGAPCGTDIVETSTVVYVEENQHKLISAERTALARLNPPAATTIRKLRESNQALRDKNAALEDYILRNMPTTTP